MRPDSPEAPRKSSWTWLPPLVSVGLVALLVYRISVPDLMQAASEIQWLLILPATVAMVLGLYVWDAVCLQVLFATPDQPVPYLRALHVRGSSYIVCALNYHLGQGVLAFGMAKLLGRSILTALSRCVVLSYHDTVVLLAMGLVGSLLSDDPLVAQLPVFCVLGLVLLAAVALSPRLVSAERRAWVGQTRVGEWMQTWGWGRSVKLMVIRTVYFSILVVYGAVVFWIANVPVSALVVLSTIPLVIMADGFPSISGLGTRETAMLLLLRPDRPEVVLALCLFWSTGLIVGRVMIGLVHLGIDRVVPSACERSMEELG